jgi:putative ABC transport system permease protein
MSGSLSCAPTRSLPDASTTIAGANPPLRHGAIRNVERIAMLPFLLAALVGVLAVASLAHALTLSIRRSRGQLAVWKSIGFTRRQVRVAVAWHASTLAVGAAVVGVPFGVVLGRLGWQVVADQIGVVSEPVTPLMGITAAVLGAVVVANAIAAFPAWSAARLPTAEALRVE